MLTLTITAPLLLHAHVTNHCTCLSR